MFTYYLKWFMVPSTHWKFVLVNKTCAFCSKWQLNKILGEVTEFLKTTQRGRESRSRISRWNQKFCTHRLGCWPRLGSKQPSSDSSWGKDAAVLSGLVRKRRRNQKVTVWKSVLQSISQLGTERCRKFTRGWLDSVTRLIKLQNWPIWDTT